MPARKSSTDRSQTTAAVVTGIIATFVAAVSAVMAAFVGNDRGEAEAAAQRATFEVIAGPLREEVSAMRGEIESLRGSVRTLSKPDASTLVGAQLRVTQRDVKAIRRDLTAISDAIGESPEKALSIPLLTRDVEALRAANADAVAAIQDDLDRQYDLMKWILGTFALGMIGLVVSAVLTVLQSRKGPSEGAGQV